MDTKEQFGVDLVFLPNHAYRGTDSDNDDRHQEFLQFAREGRCVDEGGNGWTSKKTAEYGDIYLFWFGGPVFQIAGIGVSQGCDGEPLENQGQLDWTDADYGFFCNYDPLVALANPITIDDIRGDRLLSDWWTGRPFQGGPKSVKNPDVAEQLVNLIVDRNGTKTVKQILRPCQTTNTKVK